MNRQLLAVCGASTAVLTFLTSPALAQSSEAPVARAGPSTVSELVVTAQKREESINDVAMSIQAATGDTLTKLGVTDTSQLVKIVPGFNFTPSFYGTPIYSIRGVGFHDTSLAGSPTVSVYVDEAPLPYSSMTQGATLDLERVEVLKGPQGTLFGQNATGGAINYIANKPTETFQAGLDASYGRFNTVDLQGFVSGPIVQDKLAFRVALRTLQSGPWQRSYTRSDEVGSSNFWNGRASLLFTPTDRLKALLTVSAWHDRGETQMGQLYAFAPLNPVNGVDPRILAYPLAPKTPRAADWGACVNTSPLNPPFNQQPAPYLYNPPRPLNSTTCTDFKKDNTFVGGSARIDYDLTDDIVLTSLTSHQKFDRYTPIEGDGMIYQDYESLQRGHIISTFQELRLTGSFGGKGVWLVGANYGVDKTWDNFLQTYSGSSATPVLGVRLGPTRPVNRQKTENYAVFGNAEYPVSETVTLQAGIRYTRTNKDFYGCGTDGGDGTWSAVSQQIQNLLQYVNGVISLNQYLAGQGTGINPGPGACATTGPGPSFHPADFTTQLNEDNVSWRVGANWKPNPDALVYLNISQGYKAGGFPTVATSSFTQLRPVVQEGLLAYEGGFKAGLLDRTLQLNGAVFYYDYKDKQILGALNDPVFGALPALVNVPKSHVIGFEASATWEPVQGLTIAPSVSYSKSKIEGSYFNFDAFSQYADFGGQPFPNAPKWQANIDVQYQWPLNEQMTAFVGGAVNYQGKTRSFFYNEAPTSLYPPSILDIPDYVLLDLRAGVDMDAWRFQVWGRNVTNEHYWQSAVHVNDVMLHYAGMPATYGVTATYRFR